MSKTITFDIEQLPRLHAVLQEAVRVSRGGVATVARGLGVSRTTIYRWRESRRHRINNKTVKGLCKLAGHTYRSLFTPTHRGTGVTTVNRDPARRRLMDHARYAADNETDVISTVAYWSIARRNSSVSHVMTRVDGVRFNRVAVTILDAMCILSIWQDAVGFNYKVTMTSSMENIFSDSGHVVVSGKFEAKNVAVPVKGMLLAIKAVATVRAMRTAIQ